MIEGNRDLPCISFYILIIMHEEFNADLSPAAVCSPDLLVGNQSEQYMP